VNRHPDGRLLSTDDLFQIAVDHGADPAELRAKMGSLHSANMSRSMLTSLTAKARFNDPTLKLDTRNTWTPSPPSTGVDPDVYKFLTGKEV